MATGFHRHGRKHQALIPEEERMSEDKILTNAEILKILKKYYEEAIMTLYPDVVDKALAYFKEKHLQED